MGPFMCQRIVSMTFLTDCCVRNIFFTRECVSTPWTVILTWACSGKSMFSQFVKNYLTETYFSVHITHSFVNFTWFALLNHQKDDLCWSLEYCFICGHLYKHVSHRKNTNFGKGWYAIKLTNLAKSSQQRSITDRITLQFSVVLANPFIIFWTETYFSIHTTHTSVNFTWFALLIQQEFHDKPLFMPGEQFDVLPFWIVSKIFLLLTMFKPCKVYIYGKMFRIIYIYIYIYTHTHTHRPFL